jgi:hypothetical protein
MAATRLAQTTVLPFKRNIFKSNNKSSAVVKLHKIAPNSVNPQMSEIFCVLEKCLIS